jgi:ATP-dependent helicase/nuclease subunit A
MKWNASQSRAIYSDSREILVSAAAGSGKTAVLVERIKRLIFEKGTPLSNMLVVTFTNAAAAEMRHKIVASLTDQLAAVDSPFLREQLSGIYKAAICTFHSFALKITQNYYFKIGLPPGLRVCDDAQRAMLRGEAADELFDSRFDSDYERFSAFLRRFSEGKNEDDVKKQMVIDVYEQARARPEPIAWLREKAASFGGGRENPLALLEDEIRNDIYEELGKVEAICAYAGDRLAKGGADAYAALCHGDALKIRDLRASLDEMGLDDVGALIRGFSFARLQVKDAGQRAAFKLVSDEITPVRDKAKKILNENIKNRYCRQPMSAYAEEMADAAAQAAYLCDLVAEFHERFSEKKLGRGLLDFADIEHYALAILGDSEVCEEYRGKYRHIFIDEYQDNNVMQEAIIGKIAQGNSLFMVGDVKQSIYKFRLAEPELFMARYKSYAPRPASEADSSETVLDGGERIDLNMNYRCKAPIIDAVNAVFSQLMGEGRGGVSYDGNAALRKGVAFDDEAAWEKTTDFYVLDSDVPEEAAADGYIAELKTAEAEALTAAEIIKGEIFEADGRRRRFFDTKLGRVREMGLRDVVLLLRGAKNQAGIYGKILTDEGLPAFVGAGEGYFDTVEIETFMNLLRVIDNRRHDIPLLSVMYSPIFGFSTEDLMDVRLARRGVPYYDALFSYASRAEGLPADGEGGEVCDPTLARKCRDMLSKLEEWREAAALMELDEFIWLLLKDSAYLAFAGALPGGAQRQANLRALADRALDFQKTHMKGLGSFIKYAEHLGAEVNIGQVKLIGESEDVIRVMTIHKSKGLEFPLVLVAGLGKRFRSDSGGMVQTHKDFGVAPRWTDPDSGLYKNTLLQNVIERVKRREALAEETRILYVAFTRAMDKLILLGSLPGGIGGAGRTDALIDGNSYLELLLPVVARTNIKLHGRTRLDLAPGFASEPERAGRLRAVLEGFSKSEGDAALAAAVASRLGYAYPHAGAVALKSKYSAGEISPDAGSGAGGGRARASWAPAGGAGASPGAARQAAPEVSKPKFMLGAVPFTAAEKGVILHRVIELADFREARAQLGNPGFFAAMLDGLVSRGLLRPEEAEAVDMDKITAFFGSEICGRAAGAPWMRKEAPFVYRREIDGEIVPVQGVIDCFFAEGEGLTLLDYKSGPALPLPDETREAAASRAASAYKGQLSVYKEALEAVYGKEVVESYIYFINEGVCVLVEYS